MDHFVITITRRCGSGGMSIGRLLAEHYGVPVYDNKILTLASDDSGISEQLFADADESMKQSLLYKVSRGVYKGELIPPESDDFTSNRNLFAYQAKVMKELAKKESYIVIGRAADYVLGDLPNLVRVYIHAPREICIEREMKRQAITRKEAESFVDRMDAYRQSYYTYHTGRAWNDANNYDICLDTSRYTYPEAAKLIQAFLDAHMGFQPGQDK